VLVQKMTLGCPTPLPMHMSMTLAEDDNPRCDCSPQAAPPSMRRLRVHVDPDASLLCDVGTGMGVQQPPALDLSWYTLGHPWEPMGSISVNSAAELYLAVHKAAAARGVGLALDKDGQYIELHRA